MDYLSQISNELLGIHENKGKGSKIIDVLNAEETKLTLQLQQEEFEQTLEEGILKKHPEPSHVDLTESLSNQKRLKRIHHNSLVSNRHSREKFNRSVGATPSVEQRILRR
jgi:hypothetical protein